MLQAILHRQRRRKVFKHYLKVMMSRVSMNISDHRIRGTHQTLGIDDALVSHLRCKLYNNQDSVYNSITMLKLAAHQHLPTL